MTEANNTFANITCNDIASWPVFRVSVDMAQLPGLFSLIGVWLGKDIEPVTISIDYEQTAEFDVPADLQAWAADHLKG